MYRLHLDLRTDSCMHIYSTCIRTNSDDPILLCMHTRIITSTRSLTPSKPLCSPLHTHISPVTHRGPTAINFKLERKRLQELESCLPGLRPYCSWCVCVRDGRDRKSQLLILNQLWGAYIGVFLLLCAAVHALYPHSYLTRSSAQLFRTFEECEKESQVI